jgi:glycosyltransferase involved in cell wall biosynthesis
MRIQVLTVHDPCPPIFGGSARVFHLCRALAQDAEVRVACVVGARSRAPRRETVAGFDVTRVTPYHPTLTYYWERARLLPDFLGHAFYRRWPGPLLGALDRQAAVWHLDSPVLASYWAHAPRGVLKVYASQNVEAEWFERVGPPLLARRHWARRLAALERRMVDGADLVLAVSEEDGDEFARRYGASPGKIAVIENGFDPTATRPPDAGERAAARRALGLGGERALLFVGSDFLHNRLAVADLFRHVVPQLRELEARLVLAGAVAGAFVARAEREGGGRVRCLGSLPDLLPVLWAADVALHPVTTGAGSNLKLPMYLGAALPVLSTPFGTRGFGQLAPYVTQAPVEGFATALARGLAYDPAVADPLAWYSWDAIGRRLAAVHRRWLGGETACAS